MENQETWPQSEEALLAEIRKALAHAQDATNIEDGYNRGPGAMAAAALAAFRYVGHVLGVTGFQASCADLAFLKQSRRMRGPFGIIDGEKLLYPQYDLRAQLEEWIAEWRPALAKRAAELLAAEPNAHPDVRARWAEIAALAPPTEAHRAP
jgi:hypothetical protein